MSSPVTPDRHPVRGARCIPHYQKHMKTTEITLETLIASTNIPAALVSAVVAHCGDEWREELETAARHGASGGIGQWVYYSDTCAFAKANLAGIRQLAKEQAADHGQGMLEQVAGFRCLDGDYTVDQVGAVMFGADDDTAILNALAWYALEEVGRAYLDLMGSD